MTAAARRLAAGLLPLLFAAPAAAKPRAEALYFDGRFEQALRAYHAAVLRSTADATDWLNLGVLYRDAGRAGDAEGAFSAASALRPSDPDVWEALGSAALEAGDVDKARRAFRTAVAIAPSDYYARLGLGRALLELGDAATAASHFQEAANSRRGAALAYFYLGRAREAEGDFGAARDAYQEALRQDGQFSEVRLALGRLLRRRRDVDAAWVQYARVAALDPGAGRAAKIAKELRPRLSEPPSELIPIERIASPRRVEVPSASPGEPVLRVALGADLAGRPLPQKAVEVRGDGAFTLSRKSDGKVLARAGPGEIWVLRKIPRKALYEAVGPDGRRAAVFKTPVVLKPRDARDPLVLGALPSASGFAWSQLKDREVRGAVEARPHPAGGLCLINDVTLEEYLYGVVGEEMPESWPEEALKAQAVLARTLALRSRQDSVHLAQGYDLCDGQHCQVYGGVEGESRRVREAVEGTRGLVLKHGGGLAAVFYSSDCGGHTQSASDMGWSEDGTEDGTMEGVSDAQPAASFPSTPWGFEVWLRHQPPAYCGDPRYSGPAEYRWDRVLSADALSQRVNRYAPVGRVRALIVLERARSGHVRRLEVVGDQGSWTINDETRLRRVLGLGSLRSAFFVVEAYREAGKVSEFVLHGAGWGHAVGLCQSGAAARAAQGEDFRSILADYFPRDQVRPYQEAAVIAHRPPLPRSLKPRAVVQETKS